MTLAPLRPVRKAYVYMIQRGRLLVHEHVDYPELPLALPGGTLERGEFPRQAAYREAREETGLSGGFGDIRFLGKDLHNHMGHRMRMERYFFLSFPKVTLPETWLAVEPDPSDWHEPVRIRWKWIPVTDLPPQAWHNVLRRYLQRNGVLPSVDNRR